MPKYVYLGTHSLCTTLASSNYIDKGVNRVPPRESRPKEAAFIYKKAAFTCQSSAEAMQDERISAYVMLTLSSAGEQFFMPRPLPLTSDS